MTGDRRAPRTAGPEAASGRGATRTVVAWLRGVGALLLTVAAVEYLLLPRLVEARAEVSLLTDVHPCCWCPRWCCRPLLLLPTPA